MPLADLPEVTEEPLQRNSRNAASVGRLCNALQHLRQVCLGHKGSLQILWRTDEDQANQRVRRLFPFLNSQTLEELLSEGVFLIGPEEKNPTVQSGIPFWRALGREQAPQHARNYYTPAEIKGLEHDFVALMGFGTAFAQLNLPDFWNWQAAADDASVPEAHLFAAEYFLNRLYVAVSRAREQLWIVETEEGWNAFWAKLEQWLHAQGCVSSQVDFKYTDGSQHELIDVSRGNWLDLAKRLEETAHDQRNPELFESAAFYYDRLNKRLDADRMTAWALYYRGDTVDAAKKIWPINPDTATKWWWEAEAWNQLAVRDVRPPWRKQLATLASNLTSLESRLDPSSPDFQQLARQYVSQLAAVLLDNCDKMPSESEVAPWKPWVSLYRMLVSWANRLAEPALDALQRAFESAVHLRRRMERGADLSATYAPLANLAYRLAKWQDATLYWEEANHTNHQAYFRAKAEITEYPESLQWWESAGPEYAQRVIDLFKAHRNIELDVEHRRRIARAASHLKEWELAFEVLQDNDSQLAATIWCGCAAEMEMDGLRRMLHVMHDACGKPYNDADERKRRWSNYLFDMLIAVRKMEAANELGSRHLPNAHKALVYGFSINVDPNVLARRVERSWEARRIDSEPLPFAVLPSIVTYAREWIEELVGAKNYGACANLALLTLNLICKFERRRHEESEKHSRHMQAFLRKYLLKDVKLDREDILDLQLVVESFQQVIRDALECVAQAPANFWRDAPTSDEIQAVNDCIDALAYDFLQQILSLMDKPELIADYAAPDWWLLVARFVEQAWHRRRAVDLYAALRGLADKAGWSAQHKSQLEDQKKRYDEEYQRWKQQAQTHDVLPGSDARSKLLHVVRLARAPTVYIMIPSKQYARLTVTLNPVLPDRLDFQADPGIRWNSLPDWSKRQSWSVEHGDVRFLLAWYPQSRTLQIHADERFETKFD